MVGYVKAVQRYLHIACIIIIYTYNDKLTTWDVGETANVLLCGKHTDIY